MPSRPSEVSQLRAMVNEVLDNAIERIATTSERVIEYTVVWDEVRILLGRERMSESIKETVRQQFAAVNGGSGLFLVPYEDCMVIRIENINRLALTLEQSKALVEAYRISDGNRRV